VSICIDIGQARSRRLVDLFLVAVVEVTSSGWLPIQE
jgi:hypothetical protein